MRDAADLLCKRSAEFLRSTIIPAARTVLASHLAVSWAPMRDCTRSSRGSQKVLDLVGLGVAIRSSVRILASQLRSQAAPFGTTYAVHVVRVHPITPLGFGILDTLSHDALDIGLAGSRVNVKPVLVPVVHLGLARAADAVLVRVKLAAGPASADRVELGRIRPRWSAMLHEYDRHLRTYLNGSRVPALK